MNKPIKYIYRKLKKNKRNLYVFAFFVIPLVIQNSISNLLIAFGFQQNSARGKIVEAS